MAIKMHDTPEEKKIEALMVKKVSKYKAHMKRQSFPTLQALTDCFQRWTCSVGWKLGYSVPTISFIETKLKEKTSDRQQ